MRPAVATGQLAFTAVGVERAAALRDQFLRQRVEARARGAYATADRFLNQARALQPTLSRELETWRSPVRACVALLERAALIDATAVGDGAHVWLAYGTAYRNRVRDEALRVLADHGYEEHAFPSLIPAHEFAHVDERIHPFDRVFRVSGGRREYVLKPSGEAAVYPVFRLWLARGKPLPFRVAQAGPYFRPRSHPAPYVNYPEASLMVEAHSAHATHDDMAAEFRRAQDICHEWLDDLSLSTLQLRRPRWTNYPVSERTVGFDVLLPWKKAIQTAVAYRQGQIFSRAFGVRTPAGEATFQTTFGFTERVLLTALLAGADCLGVRMPPRLAPVQAVVMPIGDAARAADAVAGDVRAAGVRVAIEPRPLERNAFFRWTVRGAPLQVVVDADAGGETVDLGERATLTFRRVRASEAGDAVREALARSHASLVAAQAERLDSCTATSTGPLWRVHVCDTESCVRSIEREWSGEVLGFVDDAPAGPCEVCASGGAPAAICGRRE